MLTPLRRHGFEHGTWFKVWESDCSNYNGCHPWFFGGDNPQSLPTMMNHWESSYGLGHNYILNLPPSKAGIITPKMAAAAAAFGQERRRRYGAGASDPDTPSECELVRGGGRMKQGDELLLELKAPEVFDRIFLSEDISECWRWRWWWCCWCWCSCCSCCAASSAAAASYCCCGCFYSCCCC